MNFKHIGKTVKQAVAVLLTIITVAGVAVAAMSVQPKTHAAVIDDDSVGAPGTYTASDSQTFLEAAGINYATYMKWLEDHDPNGPYKNYYLGTPYVGYFPGTPFYGDDYRTPNGETYAYGLQPPSYAPYNGHGMQCTGFVWNVLIRSGQRCGAPQSKLNEIPYLSGTYTYWVNHNIYRVYFPGSNCIQNALDSGIMEKGDILWIEGTIEGHTGFFYGDNPHDNKFWHSGAQHKLDSVNRISQIEPCGSALGLYVIKAIHPNRHPKIAQLAIHASPKYSYVAGKDKYSLLGSKYSVFTSYTDALEAAQNRTSSTAWDKRIGTIALDSSGYGSLKTGSCPKYADLVKYGDSHEYFKRSNQVLDTTKTYYVTQLSCGKGYELNTAVYTLTDARKNSSTYWSTNNLVRTTDGKRYYVANPICPYYAVALKINLAAADEFADAKSFLGARFAVYSSKSDAETARGAQTNTYYGQIIIDANGEGWLRKGSAPSVKQFAQESVQQEYFARNAAPRLLGTYYAVQTVAAEGYQLNPNVFEFVSTTKTQSQEGFTEIIYTPLQTVLQELVEPLTEPAKEEPITEQPTTVEPTAEEPATEPTLPIEPTTAQPVTEEPTTDASTFTVFFGDVDGDGKITIRDVTELQRYLAELETVISKKYEPYKLPLLLDFNQDGVCNVSDTTYLQRHVSEMLNDEDTIIGKHVTIHLKG